jgi:hypothetical protein
MEEYIGFGLVGLLAVSLIFGVKKFLTKKKDLYDYEDEIILDNDMVHYGPFSGSIKKSCQKLVLLVAFSSSFLSAGLDIRTIDNWGIDSWGNESVMIQKTSDNTLSNLYIEMPRPFCICTDPIITTPARTSNYNIGDKIEAMMIVDDYKPKKIVLHVQNIFENGDYLLSPQYYPSLRYAEIIRIKFAKNIELDDLLFNTKGMLNTMKQSEKICLSDYDLEESGVEDVRI